MAEPKLVGGVAVEDEGISFITAMVDERPGVVQARNPQQWFCKRPKGGYSTNFLREAVPLLVSQTPHRLSAVGISMFGLIRQDDRPDVELAERRDALIEVPRWDWHSSEKGPFYFKDLVDAWADIPVLVQNDSTTWALMEYHQLAKPEECPSFAFIRVGTGVGAGALWKGEPRPGRIHPEAGHAPVTKRAGDTRLEKGTCRAHQNHDCLEGLISEHAILNRCPGAKSLDDIPDTDDIWDLVAYYIAQLAVTLTMVLAPDQIVIAGRTMMRKSKIRTGLYDQVWRHYEDILGKYPTYMKAEFIAKFIQWGKVREDGSLRGAIELARQALFPRILG